MKLLYDLYSTQPNKSMFHGGGIYGQNLFEILANSDEVCNKKSMMKVIVHPEKFLPDNIKTIFLEKNIEAVYCSSDEQVLKAIETSECDRFYSPLPNYLFKLLKKPLNTDIAVTIHGLRFLDTDYSWFRRQYQPVFYKKKAMVFFDLIKNEKKRNEKKQVENFLRTINGPILTDSLHSKYQILNEFPFLSPEKVKVIYAFEKEIAQLDINAIEKCIKKHDLKTKKYFLLISCNRPGKNALRVLAALNNFDVLKNKDFQMACVGFTKKQIARVKKIFPITYKYCRFIPYVPFEELHYLYRGAFCFIFPSLSEGFGYPPLEAMRHGVPVIASSVTSIPEVCGDAVLYTNPYNIDEIANRIKMIIEENELRESLIEKGYHRVIIIENIHSENKKIIIEELLK